MHKKIICVIANGYAEEMMASTLMDQIRLELGDRVDDYFFVGGSLVSSGRWYQDKRFATFYSGGISPSGGFPTRSIKGFFSDLFAGVFRGPFKLSSFVKQWADNGLEMVVVVGDFLLLATAMPALKRKKVPCVFIPTAKSDHIQPHFKIEKKYIKKYASISFPRDEKTAQDFQEFGINAEYAGNLMQDLLVPSAKPLKADEPIIALLPGSREESYGNFYKILSVVERIHKPVHWALVQASVLDPAKIEQVFLSRNWQKGDSCWTHSTSKVYVYSGSEFDSVALGCITAISLAGSAGEQIVGLGKPVVGFKGVGPQSTDGRMQDNAKLLGEAFIYEQNVPEGVAKTLNTLLTNDGLRASKGALGIERMGQTGGSKRIAQKLIELYLK
ncbi:MAG: hypothetical protein ACRCY4_09195 [Brevinema sp.]